MKSNRMKSSAKMELVTCKNCGIVYMGCTREYAQAEVESFNEMFYNAKAKGEELCWDKPATIAIYENPCGKGKLKPAAEGDCPIGCTITTIIYE